jgi:hypothetical protein
VTISRAVGVAVLALGVFAADAGAQARRGVAVEGVAGWVGFADDATIQTTAIGAAARIPVSPRVSIGPEVLYLIGDGGDRDLFVLGSVWFDIVEATPQRRVVPYLTVGAGYMRHDENFGSFRFISGDFVIEGGGGARVRLSDRVYVGADVQVGSELHLRTTAHVGVTWPRR